MSDIFEHFPEMTPIQKAPSLRTINGIGTTAYGRRDADPETGTYVTTVWFALVFIPFVPLGAYRVANAPGGGQYFIGKVPVSGAAKAWSLFLCLAVAAVAGSFVWHHYINTPSYLAGRRLDRADSLRKDGKLAEAAELYRDVAEGGTNKSPAAMQAVAGLLDSPELQGRQDPAEMAAVFRVAWELRERPGAVQDLFTRGLRFAEARAADHPEASLAVLEAVEPAAPAPKDYLPLKQKVLEALTTDQPRDIDLLSKLAVVYELNGQRDRCLPLLEPHRHRLGASEGARILGQIYFDKDKQAEAFALLQPYADERLQALQHAEQQYEKAVTSAQESLIADLQGGKAAGFDYKRYEKAAQVQRNQMINDYLANRFKDKPELKRQQELLFAQMSVVPVALDLGIIRLGRAQAMTRPEERKAELERAEKTFLAVRGLAGDRAEYQISLAQVYYWLGIQADGRKLFDEALQASGRKFETLYLIGHLLHELGASAEARVLLEEAYNKPGGEPRQRQTAAYARALTATDLDDQIPWLERANPADPHVKASLANSRGRKSLREGKDADAAACFREAVSVYASQPETSATLNNGGLASLELYEVTGEREALDRGVQLLEKALQRKLGDGILTGNVADSILRVGLAELVAQRIDFQKLKRRADVSDLQYLYRDADERLALVRRVRDNATIVRARSHYDRALILAPNNPALYAEYQELLHFLGDRDGLANLDRRAAESKPDLEAARQDLRDHWEGKKDAQWRAESAVAVARAERILADTKIASGTTFARAAAALVHARLGQEALDMPFDADAAVQEAEQAHQAAPSPGTRSSLQSALLARAHKDLSAKEAEYAALVSRSKRSLNSSDLIAVALWREGALRPRVLANGDVQRVLQMIRDDFAQFPDEPHEWSWAMLRAAHPEDAGRMAQALAANELLRLKRALEVRLSPQNPGMALQQCWMLDSAGKTAEAREILKRAAAAGVPLPFDPS